MSLSYFSYVHIGRADLDAEDVRQLLAFHVEAGRSHCASHVYGAERLIASGTVMFEARDEHGRLMGFAGLKQLSGTEGEIKSVRTHPEHLRKGVCRALMEHVTAHARSLGLKRLLLETHPTAQYAAARALYERLGYQYCPPFGDYEDTGESVFMMREIEALRLA